VVKSFPELMGAAEAARELGVTRQRVNQLAQTEAFPKPVAVLDAGRIWLAADIRAWMIERAQL
jgi:predicted DNA-binding transcriptional regulator AlpA